MRRRVFCSGPEAFGVDRALALYPPWRAPAPLRRDHQFSILAASAAPSFFALRRNDEIVTKEKGRGGVPAAFNSMENKRRAGQVIWIECIGFGALLIVSWLDELVRLPQ